MDRETLELRYAEAGSLRALARSLGVSPPTARKYLDQHAIEVTGVRPQRIRKPVEPTAEERKSWRDMYELSGSISEMARRLGMSTGNARHHLRRLGIPINRTGYKSPKTVVYHGADHWNWKGGTYMHEDGYVMQYAPNHPGNLNGYVLQHRLVMEGSLGRYLMPHEIVHHKNEVKDDNRPDNLELTNRSDHMKGHKADTMRDDKGRFLA